ncbi:hypothetical protein [Streptomyces sp. NBC_00249]|uniref:hypothetical protein n=1 Tax=Streptomyces sp. NBC_00249 TaxID=2975690 RepID=UPI002B1DE128|nr:hypothetical protein [Streptomyces sp. NBC_00249]
MPLVGFIAPKDPRWLSTLDAMDAELVSDSLVYRYDPETSPDGLEGDELSCWSSPHLGGCGRGWLPRDVLSGLGGVLPAGDLQPAGHGAAHARPRRPSSR